MLQQEMEGNHPKTFRRMAGGKGQELACAAAWDGVMVVSATLALLCINAYAEKTDSMGPGIWYVHLGLLGGESMAQPWEGSAGSWAALPQPQIREDKSLHLGRLLL